MYSNGYLAEQIYFHTSQSVNYMILNRDESINAKKGRQNFELNRETCLFKLRF